MRRRLLQNPAPRPPQSPPLPLLALPETIRLGLWHRRRLPHLHATPHLSTDCHMGAGYGLGRGHGVLFLQGMWD